MTSNRLSAAVALAYAAGATALAGLPFSAHADAPRVSWSTPSANATLSGTISGSACAASASASVGMSRVTFWMDNYQINNDYSSPYNCSLDTRKLRDGTYTMRVDAYSSKNELTRLTRTVTIRNSTASTNKAPTVRVTSPTQGQSVSGSVNYAADASDDQGVSRVDFRLDGSLIQSDTTRGFGGTVRDLKPGSHTLTATAYDAAGLSATSSVTFSVPSTTTTSPSPSTGDTSTTLPSPTAGSLDVWFKAPLAGQTLSGVLSNDKCYVKGIGVSRVSFFVDGAAAGSDTNVADGMSCTLDTTKLANGAHTLMATAYDANGGSRSDVIRVNVENAAATPPPTTEPTTPPPATTPAPGAGNVEVWFKAPLGGQTVSGSLSGDKCYVNGTGAAKVQFFLDGTALNTDSTVSDGMNCALDTTKFANGTHQLRAVAYDAAGGTYNEQISINIQNAATTPPPATGGGSGGTGGTVSNLPNGGSAVATFHSLGLYYKPSSNPGSAGCLMQYRKTSDSAWKKGLNLWYDSRNSECRGSLVQLEPGTEYEVQLGTGSTFSHKVVAKTWAEQFPIAQTITLPAGTVTQPLNITSGGSAGGYVLYQAHPNGTTIDVQNAYDNNVTISAPYVIVRGVTMRNARINGVELRPGAHHIVIENNDISNWGRRNYVNSAGWEVGVDMDSAVRAKCGSASSVNASMNTFVVQRNRIHDPRYGANAWDWGHPAGPQGVTFSYCGGNNVIRYNEIRSSNERRFFNDAISGEDNFTNTGFPNNDSDIYGNLIEGVMDDGIEAEGGNRNVRVWGNYLNKTGTGIASTVVATGPLYIFRNVYNQSRKRYLNAYDSDDRGPFFKAGSINSTTGDGRRYVFHNTALQPSGSGAANGLGAGIGIEGNTGQALTNTVTRNNIFHIWKSNWTSINQTSGGHSNDADYDLYNGSISANSGAESHGIKGVPVYASGHGPSSGSNGYYQLSPSSPGFDKGVRIPGFNDDFLGTGPDMGATETGKPPMKFGIQ